MVFEPLADYHDRAGFSCGIEELDKYFHKYARQNMEKGVAAVFVLVRRRGSKEVLGFYTLSATALDAGKLPKEFLKKLPRYQHLPATLIGRLARSADLPGKGIGEKLLANAIRRCVKNSEIIGSLAVVVDAKDDRVKMWYLKYGFQELKDQPNRLFLPLESLKNQL
jgi:predicted GNAT family N-acyltransferase